MKILYLTEDTAYNYVILVDHDNEKATFIDYNCTDDDIQKIIDKKNDLCNEETKWYGIDECFRSTRNTKILAFIINKKWFTVNR